MENVMNTHIQFTANIVFVNMICVTTLKLTKLAKHFRLLD